MAMELNEAVFSSWLIQIEPALMLMLSAIFYVRGWLRIRHLAPQRLTFWRPVSFLGALILLFITIFSPIDTFANLLLMVHMIQHLLLMMVIPPLLLLGYPFLPILSGLPKPVTLHVIAPFLTWEPLKKFGKRLTSPPVCWLSYIGTILFWHLPPCYELTLHSDNWHLFEHVCFLITGILFWWPIVQPWPSRPQWPRWTMIPYLLLADIQNTALSAFLSFYDKVVYPSYEKVPHFSGITALTDQAIAGAIMWVPGSIIYLIPAGLIALQYLSPAQTRSYTAYHRTTPFPKPTPGRSRRSNRTLDLTALPLIGRWIRSYQVRRLIQTCLFLLAIAIVIDGFTGPQVAPMNLAGTLPWTHWRGFTVLALLIFGNFFCYACPFTFVRDLGRHFLRPRWNWPRFLRSKWIAILLIVLFLWSYEAFSLWNSPWLTAWVIVGYFGAAMLVDGLFRGASFCKYLCPIGQFHFVQSLLSPFEVKVRKPDVCTQCKTFDCIKGNDSHRGCELRLFQPKKQSNMDCTFCLDCVQACPHENVGILATNNLKVVLDDRSSSSIGRFSHRIDIAFLIITLVFGSYANAASMTVPAIQWLSGWQFVFGIVPRPVVLAVFFLAAVFILPSAIFTALTLLSRRLFKLKQSAKELFASFVMGFIPLGAAMWFAHFIFHLFTGSHTPIPVIQRIAAQFHLTGSSTPNWTIKSWAIPELLDFEVLALDLGFLASLYIIWHISLRLRSEPRTALPLFLLWSIFAIALFLVGIWILFQPMDMRGTFS
jgi:cytochrome c oxidase assembly factor CtaG